MSTPFQNRLVGTIIVAAVAIIFLPDVLDGDKKTYQDNFEAIPDTPEVTLTPADKTFPEQTLSRIPQEDVVDETAIDDLNAIDSSQLLTEKGVSVSTLKKEDAFTADVAKKSANNATNKVIKKLPPKATPKQAWVIQLGSFRHQNNVDDLVNKLKQNGYTVFTKPIKTKNGKLTKVFVGPELIKKSLEDKISALKKLTNVQGKVARFSPAKG